MRDLGKEGQGSLTVSYVDWSYGYHHVYMLITITISLAALAPQTLWLDYSSSWLLKWAQHSPPF